MSQYEPMREISREELLAELNKIALRPIGPSWANLGHEANAEAYALHRSTRCSPKVSDIEATKGRVCPKAFGGEVTLAVTSSCCEPNNGKFSIKDGGWKNMEGMPGVEYKDGGKGDHGDGPEHKEITIDLSKFPYDIEDGDWELKWEGKCDQEPGDFDSETTIKQSSNCEQCPEFKINIDDYDEECKKDNKVNLTVSTNKNVSDDDVKFTWFQGSAGDDIKLGQGTNLAFTCGKDNENKSVQSHKFTVVATHSSDTCELERQATSCVVDVKSEAGSDGGEVSSHCTDMEATGGCSSFRFDCTTDSAELCVGEKGKVNLIASTHGCDSDTCPGTELSYVWYESDRKDGGWKVVNEAGGKELVAKPPSNLESGDKYYYKCKATCGDFPGGSVTIEGGGGEKGEDIIVVKIVDCCNGDDVCKNGKQCCNKDDHPDHPEGCQECCKNKQCEGDKVCVNGKCKDAKCPDPCQVWSESFSTCVQKCNPGQICDPNTGDCTEEWQDECSQNSDCSGKKSKCCTKSGKKVCQECCSNSDCPDGKCVNGECVPNGEPDPGPDDPCKGVECPEGEICKDGECVPDPDFNPCEGVECPEGEICEDGQCVEDPNYDLCKDVECPDGSTGAGPAQCVEGDCICDDENAIIIGGECVCGNGFEWDEENEICIPNGTSTPPPDIEEDPCFGVVCTPPQECVEGECVCPEGTELINGLCLDPDPCLGVLCPPNAECVDGICTCLPGYVVDDKGNCVMAETPGCDPPEDCCPANSTICVQAGSGLGGGGCFTLNQDCDKTIMLWVDPNHEAVDDDCDEHGLQQICACTKEIQMLTDMITSLTARIAELEQVQGVIDGQAVIDRNLGGGHFQTSQ